MRKTLILLTLASALTACDSGDQAGGNDSTGPAAEQGADASADSNVATNGADAAQAEVPYGDTPRPGNILRSGPDGQMQFPGWQWSGSKPWSEIPSDCCVDIFWRGDQGEEILFALTKPLTQAADGTVQSAEILTTYTVRLARSEVISSNCRVNGRPVVLGMWNVERRGFRAVMTDGRQFTIHRQPFFNDGTDQGVECVFESVSETGEVPEAGQVEPGQGSVGSSAGSEMPPAAGSPAGAVSSVPGATE